MSSSTQVQPTASGLGTTERAGDWTVLVLGDTFAQLNESNVQPARAEISGVIESGDGTSLLLDMTNVQFFGSSFIEVLFRAHEATKAAGGEFAMCALSAYCLEVLEVTRLSTMWACYQTRAEADTAIAPA